MSTVQILDWRGEEDGRESEKEGGEGDRKRGRVENLRSIHLHPRLRAVMYASTEELPYTHYQ